MTRLILLDRDGVINADSPEYIKDVDEWQALPGSLEAVAGLKKAGYLVAVCTNQAGIGRGILTESALLRIHQKMALALASLGCRLDAVAHCPHAPEAGCQCRKPRPGMLIRMMDQFRVDPGDTLFVGDKLTDMQAAISAGCLPVLVRTGHGASVESQACALGVSWIEDDLTTFVDSLIQDISC